jgi:Domain of unknown function (DUF4124)
MRLGFVVAMIAFSCSVAWAAVYEWIDSRGVLNMTDNLELVPEKYRKVMTTRDIDIDAASPAADTRIPAEKAPLATQAESRGGHDKAWWHNRFAQTKGQIADFQEQIAEKKKAQGEAHWQRDIFGKPSEGIAANKLLDEIAKDEGKVKGLQKDLDNLTSQADTAGVPPDWR